jgi:hypothetical protein
MRRADFKRSKLRDMEGAVLMMLDIQLVLIKSFIMKCVCETSCFTAQRLNN